MKAMWTLKPLAFAVAAGLTFPAAAQEPPPTQALNIVARVVDNQTSNSNEVENQLTENFGRLEGSLGGAAGNVGVNIAGGDHNQQANAAALASADQNFVFQTATASVRLEQLQTGTNTVENIGTNNQSLLNNVGNFASGNVGINVASGVFNQQKNDFATTTASATTFTASSNVTQTYTNNVTNNTTQSTDSVPITLTGPVTGTYSGQSDQVGNVYLDVWNSPAHPNGTVQLGHVDVDNEAQGAEPGPNGEGAFLFDEAGNISLGATLTGSVPVFSRDSAVVNNAHVVNALNSASGNVGLNVTAGSGNQQSNSLAIAAGCNACNKTPAPTPTGL